jgi:tetratricopeptide (TPR) repeat protein
MLHDTVSPLVRTLYSYYLVGAGRSGEAIRQMERALKDDPVNTYCCFGLALCGCIAGQYEEAVAGFLQTQELDGNFAAGHGWLAVCYISRGMFAQALPCVEKWHQLLPQNLDWVGFLAGLLARIGEGSRAQELVRQLVPEKIPGAVTGLYFFHLISANIGETADWAEKAVGQRHPGVISYVLCPIA